MSLPTNGKPSTSQPSIRSFFQSKAPQYAPPPPSSKIAPPPPPTAPPAPSTPSTPSSHPAPPPTLPPLPPTLPDEATIRPPTQDDITPLKRINSLLLPVSYSEDFYAAKVSPQDSYLSRVIEYQHSSNEGAKVVGGVMCALGDSPGQPITSAGGEKTLYVQCLCILSPYRGLGLVGMALENIVNTVRLLEAADVKTVTAHVWSENEEGLGWYDKQSFGRERLIEGYYSKLRPGSAYLVSRALDFNSALSPSSTAAKPQPGPTAAAVNLPATGAPPSRPPPRATSSGQSYMEKRADMEWNDLPADMAPVPKRQGLSEPVSSASSRSSSTARKKRDRSYPAAAFGKQ